MTDIAFKELAALHGKEFINCCYRKLLHRNPDPSGMSNYIAKLKAGESKALIVNGILTSTEGRNAGERVSGLLIPYWIAVLEEIPILGRAVAAIEFIVNAKTYIDMLRGLENSIPIGSEISRHGLDLTPPYTLVPHFEDSYRHTLSDIERSVRLLRRELSKLTFQMENTDNPFTSRPADSSRVMRGSYDDALSEIASSVRKMKRQLNELDQQRTRDASRLAPPLQ